MATLKVLAQTRREAAVSRRQAVAALNRGQERTAETHWKRFQKQDAAYAALAKQAVPTLAPGPTTALPAITQQLSTARAEVRAARLAVREMATTIHASADTPVLPDAIAAFHAAKAQQHQLSADRETAVALQRVQHGHAAPTTVQEAWAQDYRFGGQTTLLRAGAMAALTLMAERDPTTVSLDVRGPVLLSEDVAAMRAWLGEAVVNLKDDQKAALANWLGVTSLEADWDESKHPRGDGGKFASGTGHEAMSELHARHANAALKAGDKKLAAAHWSASAAHTEAAGAVHSEVEDPVAKSKHAYAKSAALGVKPLTEATDAKAGATAPKSKALRDLQEGLKGHDFEGHDSDDPDRSEEAEAHDQRLRKAADALGAVGQRAYRNAWDQHDKQQMGLSALAGWLGVTSLAAEWDESEHPRAGDGKFTSGGGDSVHEDTPAYGEKTRLVPDAPALSTPRPINGTIRSGMDENVVTVPYGREGVLKSGALIQKYIASGRDVTVHGVGSGTASITDFQPGSTLVYRYAGMTKVGTMKVPSQTVPWDGTIAPKVKAEPKSPVDHAAAAKAMTDADLEKAHNDWAKKDRLGMLPGTAPARAKRTAIHNEWFSRKAAKDFGPDDGSTELRNAVAAWNLADWDESQHPRAGDGKFTSGGGARITESQVRNSPLAGLLARKEAEVRSGALAGKAAAIKNSGSMPSPGAMGNKIAALQGYSGMLDDTPEKAGTRAKILAAGGRADAAFSAMLAPVPMGGGTPADVLNTLYHTLEDSNWHTENETVKAMLGKDYKYGQQPHDAVGVGISKGLEWDGSAALTAASKALKDNGHGDLSARLDQLNAESIRRTEADLKARGE